MGYDKFGLDWNVWGPAPKKEMSSPSNALLNSIGKGWSTSPNKSKNEESQDEVPQKKEITARLLKPRFEPDETTDFNKPCKVIVDIDSKQPVSSSVVFSLWGRYKNKEYNLQHEIKATPKGGVAEGVVKLYYIDEYYNDLAINGPDGQGVEYVIKCSMKGANPVESEPLKMPRTKEIVLEFRDDQGKPIPFVTITVKDGVVYSSDQDGKIIIPGGNDMAEVEVIKIELAGSI
jgi:hypothetical protein